MNQWGEKISRGGMTKENLGRTLSNNNKTQLNRYKSSLYTKNLSSDFSEGEWPHLRDAEPRDQPPAYDA